LTTIKRWGIIEFTLEDLMPKKAQKAKKIKPKGPTLMDRLPNNHGEWLLLCIKFTKRAITHPELESQAFLVKQAERIEKELEDWKIANPNETLRDMNYFDKNRETK
jgi:hypothetical protein